MTSSKHGVSMGLWEFSLTMGLAFHVNGQLDCLFEAVPAATERHLERPRAVQLWSQLGLARSRVLYRIGPTTVIQGITIEILQVLSSLAWTGVQCTFAHSHGMYACSSSTRCALGVIGWQHDPYCRTQQHGCCVHASTVL